MLTMKFDVEHDSLKSIPKSAELIKKSGKNCIASKHSSHFLKLPKRNGVNHLVSNRNFRFFHVNVVSTSDRTSSDRLIRDVKDK